MSKHKKPGAGRKIGTLSDLSNPRVRIVTLKMDASKSFGQQLKQAREAVGFTGSAVARAIGWHESNINHFENNTGSSGQSIHTALKYAKAMGIRRLIFEL
jgi:DNA-binding XRE family transcriptional regulator